jgi:4-hydroxy-tetrahydrodipicolinate synthase
MEGVWSVIPTIFDSGDHIDYNSMQNIIDKQINAKINGIVINGTTSEVSTLSDSEKQEIYERIVKTNNHKIPIMIGVGGNCTKDVISEIEKCKRICDYIMLTVPYYNKPSQEGLIAHFTHICTNYIDSKFVIYNIPGRTGVNLDTDSLVSIVESCPNIIGVKEASGNMAQIKNTINRTNISIMSGDDSLFVPLMSIGAKGVISVISNIVPEQMVEIYSLCKANDFFAALEIYNKIEHIAETCFITSNPVPLKIILFRLGITNSESVRLPLVITRSGVLLNKIHVCALKIDYL